MCQRAFENSESLRIRSIGVEERVDLFKGHPFICPVYVFRPQVVFCLKIDQVRFSNEAIAFVISRQSLSILSPTMVLFELKTTVDGH